MTAPRTLPCFAPPPSGHLPLKVVFAVSEQGVQAAAGDVFTAQELGAALARRNGWAIEYRPLGESWYDLRGVDVLIAMREDYDLRAIRGAAVNLIKVAWARNWFERWCEQPWAREYDLLLASSRLAAQFMAERLGKLPRLLRIATNPERFASSHSATPALDYVFTGSYWQSERDIVAALTAMPPGLRGAVYGKHWDQVPELAQLNRGFMPYERLHEVYRQAAIVIDDANHVTKAWGAANSRVFDALAAGCLVITNSATVSEEVFGGSLPVYHSPAQLRDLLQRYVEDPAAREARALELRQQVMQKHLYRHRAFELGLYLSALMKDKD
ncbi:MAG: glycosyltransferase family 1 protein [Proteobacteria bacterium]|nr:glycosyltransferase family 1 protein [Pseudomonadota bacterium]